MVNDQEIEKIAVKTVTEYEEARGWKVESVEDENREFDLISFEIATKIRWWKIYTVCAESEKLIVR